MIKQEEIDTKQTGCCGGEAMQDDTGCCGGGMMEDGTGCCGGEALQGESGCCSHPYDTRMSDSAQEERIPSQLKKDSLEQLQKIVGETNDKYIRLYSEFDNFKRRIAKERIALTDRANEQTLKELLPIIDDFERCITVLQKDKTHVQQATQEGIKLIYDKLMLFLQRFNVAEMQLAAGTPFNADLHEAIMQQSVETEEMKGKIISVVERGYLINTYVLRFAKVVIGV